MSNASLLKVRKVSVKETAILPIRSPVVVEEPTPVEKMEPPQLLAGSPWTPLSVSEEAPITEAAAVGSVDALPAPPPFNLKRNAP
jgi:hypothetical protein